MSEVSLAPGWRSAMAEEARRRRDRVRRTQPSSLSSSPSSAAVRPVLTEDWLPSISYRTTVPSLLTPMALRARREDAASMPEVVTVPSSMSSLPPTAYSTSLPCRVCGGDGERDLFAVEIDPRGDVGAAVRIW